MSSHPDTHEHCGYCGTLDWTVRDYGRVTHKEGCPHRTDPWSQTWPGTDADNADAPFRPSPSVEANSLRSAARPARAAGA